jgi:hypothetical protein
MQQKCHSAAKAQTMNLPTPIGLLQDKGVIGEILRQMPRPVLDEAEKHKNPWFWLARWVKKNPVEHWGIGTVEMRDATCAELEKEGFKRTGTGVYQSRNKRHNAKIFRGFRKVCFYHHQCNPTQIYQRVVIDKRWPDGLRKTFVAAASKWEAELRLAEIARGGGSISQSWRLKIRAAQKSGDRKMADHWAHKLAANTLQWEKGRQWLLKDAPPKVCEIARQKYEKFYAAGVRRLGKKKADQKWKGRQTPRFKVKSNSDKIAEAMITGWLTGGSNGFPGMCFMSDELLAKFLGYILPLPSLLTDSGLKLIVTTRQRIGLKKAEILFSDVKKDGEQRWAIMNLRGEKAYWFSLRKRKCLPPIL